VAQWRKQKRNKTKQTKKRKEKKTKAEQNRTKTEEKKERNTKNYIFCVFRPATKCVNGNFVL